MLEEQMQELRELPARVAGVESQIVQLREEMREAFSATRSELLEKVGGLQEQVDGLDGRLDGLDGRLDGLHDELRAEMHGVRNDLRNEMQSSREELRAEIRDGDQATRDFMRMLFEHHQTNLRTIGEGTKKRKR
jgi:predicted  nucleic acid-binding Zn-ribbon protein